MASVTTTSTLQHVSSLLPLLLLLLLLGEGGGVPDDAKDLTRWLVKDGGGTPFGGLKGLSGLPAELSTLLKLRNGSAHHGRDRDRDQGVPPPLGATALDPNEYIKPPVFPEEDAWPGSCRLRSKRYVSDGLCVSTRPVNEVVCAVSCVMNAWSKQAGTRPLPWRCTDSGWKRQRVKLLCRDGSTRTYRIRVVQTCRCVPRARAAALANQLEE